MIDWINTKDKIPETFSCQSLLCNRSKEVLILLEDGIVIIARYEWGYYDEGDKWENWYDIFACDSIDISNVKYWAEFNLPEEEQKIIPTKRVFNKIKEITIWERYNVKKKQWEHNHISDGFAKEDKPIPVSDNQKKAWKKAEWRKQMALLINNVVYPYVKIVVNNEELK